MQHPLTVMNSALAVLGPAFTALLCALSCNSTPTNTPASEPTPTPSPHQVMELSRARMLTLDTASFTLEDEGETGARFFGLKFELMEGQIRVPDSFNVRVEAISTFPRSFIELNIVSVGDRAFMTDFLNKEKWNPVAADALPFNFADLGRTLSEIIPFVRVPTFVGTETVDEVRSWRIQGTVASERLSALVPGVASGYEAGIELWIGQDQDLLRKIRIEGRIYNADSADVVRVLKVHSFDEPVQISLSSISDQ